MTTPATPATWRFWRAFGTTLRPYLMFLSLAAGLVGLALTELGVEVVGYALVFFLTYGLGQAVTDTFQMDTDALSAPERPLVRDEVRPSDVRVVALVALVSCALVFFAANPWTALPAAASVAGLLSYTWFKRQWWGGPPWNAWIVALLPVIGVLCGGVDAMERLLDPRLWLAVVSTFATYVCFVLLGYLKDVDADSATGYRTFAVQFGRRPAIVLSLAHAVIGSLASAALVFAGSEFVLGHVLWGLGLIALVVAHPRLWSITTDRAAYPGIERCALGFVGIHLGEAAVLRPSLGWGAVAVFALAIAAMRLRPTREQI